MKLFISKITFRILSRILNKFLCLKTKINRENIIISRRTSLSQRREKLNFPTNFGDKGDEEEDPFSGSPASIFPSSLPFSSAQGKNKRKQKKKDDTKYRCVRGAQRSEEERKKREERKKKKRRRNNETCFQLANKFPLSSILPTLLSSRIRATMLLNETKNSERSQR